VNEGLIERLRGFLAGREDLAWAILFGSQARGTARPDSDVDIAISPHEPLSTAEEADLAVALERVAGTPVDLVVIDRARPALRWRIARDGVVLVSSPRHAAARFLARTGIEHDANRQIERDAMRRYRARLAQPDR
jgi:predicted nucleotidyltransferase